MSNYGTISDSNEDCSNEIKAFVVWPHTVSVADRYPTGKQVLACKCVISNSIKACPILSRAVDSQSKWMEFIIFS